MIRSELRDSLVVLKPRMDLLFVHRGVPVVLGHVEQDDPVYQRNVVGSRFGLLSLGLKVLWMGIRQAIAGPPSENLRV